MMLVASQKKKSCDASRVADLFHLQGRVPNCLCNGRTEPNTTQINKDL